jgi:hypothetical protein
MFLSLFSISGQVISAGILSISLAIFMIFVGPKLYLANDIDN